MNRRISEPSTKRVFLKLNANSNKQGVQAVNSSISLQRRPGTLSAQPPSSKHYPTRSREPTFRPMRANAATPELLGSRPRTPAQFPRMNIRVSRQVTQDKRVQPKSRPMRQPMQEISNRGRGSAALTRRPKELDESMMLQANTPEKESNTELCLPYELKENNQKPAPQIVKKSNSIRRTYIYKVAPKGERGMFSRDISADKVNKTTIVEQIVEKNKAKETNRSWICNLGSLAAEEDVAVTKKLRSAASKFMPIKKSKSSNKPPLCNTAAGKSVSPMKASQFVPGSKSASPDTSVATMRKSKFSALSKDFRLNRKAFTSTTLRPASQQIPRIPTIFTPDTAAHDKNNISEIETWISELETLVN